MKILCFAGSLRAGSYNKLQVKIAHEVLSGLQGVESKLIQLNDFAMPVLNQDLEAGDFPPKAVALGEEIKNCQALVISTPENNGSIAAVLKNSIDWVSRPKGGNPWPGKHVLLMGASIGMYGAVPGLWQTRVPFEKMGCHVYPELLGLPRAQDAFDEKGAFKDKASHERLAKLVNAYVEFLRPRFN